ncbi:hypothetical protein RRG08_063923 [Elysia crispata]|uniref:Uncharacterized protein n=1 Tax=Elysia crispata TaxID=231223 RepID=A0AAE0YEQ4_9GAST|nr:hypothetical protein RRG08_063923 [Elysia crispata]
MNSYKLDVSDQGTEARSRLIRCEQCLTLPQTIQCSPYLLVRSEHGAQMLCYTGTGEHLFPHKPVTVQ